MKAQAMSEMKNQDFFLQTNFDKVDIDFYKKMLIKQGWFIYILELNGKRTVKIYESEHDYNNDEETTSSDSLEGALTNIQSYYRRVLIEEIATPNPLLAYRKTGRLDINGVEILEGSIINADGYKSDLEKKIFHCVEYDEMHPQSFGSDIRGDFDPLSSYKKIEVIGHCSTYAHLLECDEWEGNLGAVCKTYAY
jgi:hypothetical protein